MMMLLMFSSFLDRLVTCQQQEQEQEHSQQKQQ